MVPSFACSSATPPAPIARYRSRSTEQGGGAAREPRPDSYRLLLALACPAGVAAIGEITEKARLSQSAVTRKLREQAKRAVLELVQELYDDPENRAELTKLASDKGIEALARQLWAEALIPVYRLLFILKLESSPDPARAFSFASTSLWRRTYWPNTALAPLVREVRDKGAETGRMLSQGDEHDDNWGYEAHASPPDQPMSCSRSYELRCDAGSTRHENPMSARPIRDDARRWTCAKVNLYRPNGRARLVEHARAGKLAAASLLTAIAVGPHEHEVTAGRHGKRHGALVAVSAPPVPPAPPPASALPPAPPRPPSGACHGHAATPSPSATSHAPFRQLRSISLPPDCARRSGACRFACAPP
jgi:hypothetical protein